MAFEIMTGGSGGSVFHNMNKSTFSAIEILDTDIRTICAFEEQVSPLHAMILSNEKQSQHLAAQRDALLPRLVSGRCVGGGMGEAMLSVSHLRGSLNLLDVKGVDAKISRARECLQGLENDIDDVLRISAPRTCFRVNRAASDKALLLAMTYLQRCLIDYSIRVGEIAYNLRSALDSPCVAASFLDNGGTPSFQTGFPIVLEDRSVLVERQSKS